MANEISSILLIKLGAVIFVFTSGSLLTLISLNTTKAKPGFYLENFYVPALNTFDGSCFSRNSNVIFFDLEFDMDQAGVRYDKINLSFFYGQDTSHPIGNYTIPGFYQGKGKKGHGRDIVVIHGVNWEDALRQLTVFDNRSTSAGVSFRLDLSTKFKLKDWYIYSKKRRLDVGAKVEINKYGMKVEDKAIKLTSAASASTPVALWVIFNVLIACLLLV